MSREEQALRELVLWARQANGALVHLSKTGPGGGLATPYLLRASEHIKKASELLGSDDAQQTDH